MNNRKLTRSEACLQLGEITGLGDFDFPKQALIPIEDPTQPPLMLPEPDAIVTGEAPNFFEDREAATALAQWVVDNSEADSKLWDDFIAAFLRLRFGDAPTDPWKRIQAAFCATPEQITLAACAALGIAVE